MLLDIRAQHLRSGIKYDFYFMQWYLPITFYLGLCSDLA